MALARMLRAGVVHRWPAAALYHSTKRESNKDDPFNFDGVLFAPKFCPGSSAKRST
jgi:hypothetical protein